jgi:hypothetical protein
VRREVGERLLGHPGLGGSTAAEQERGSVLTIERVRMPSDSENLNFTSGGHSAS